MKSHAEWLREAAIYTGFGRTDFDAGARDRMREIADELESSALKLDTLERTKIKYDNLCNVLNEQAAEIKALETRLGRVSDLLETFKTGTFLAGGTGITKELVIEYLERALNPPTAVEKL
jgi:hypothetical protein